MCASPGLRVLLGDAPYEPILFPLSTPGALPVVLLVSYSGCTRLEHVAVAARSSNELPPSLPGCNCNGESIVAYLLF